jgi:ubiquinone/menaquinone biosynthesis C-methylase UbiE
MRYFTRYPESVSLGEEARPFEVEFCPEAFLLEDGELVVTIKGCESGDFDGPGETAAGGAYFGEWSFPLKGASTPISIAVQLGSEEPSRMVRADCGEGKRQLDLSGFEHNPDFCLSPRLRIDLILKEKGEERERAGFFLELRDARLLAAFYSREGHHQEAYSSENQFHQVFHFHRLRLLRGFFNRYFRDGDRILDVGSGQSMIRFASPRRRFELTCCDLDEYNVRRMEKEAPECQWLVADAAQLPLEDDSFDLIFAGEILEHLPDPRKGLKEWARVLKPGGLLILTTPNRERLVNRLNHAREVVNPEHLSEMGYRELLEMLREEGFKIKHKKGIYLEYFLYRTREGKWVDLLPFFSTRYRCGALIHLGMYVGRIFRPFAFDLVFVARKT